MTSEWKKKTIAEICTLVTDGSHTSPKSVDAGQYMVSVKDFTHDGFDFTNCRKISEADYLVLEKSGCVPNVDDILIGKDGARFFEDIVIYRQNERPALLSSIAILRCNKEVVLPEFLYYTLKKPAFRADVRENYGSGSAIPRIILKDFKRMSVYVPPLAIQHAIVDVLAAIDRRIVENRKINHHLAAARSATESSPDIKRGKSASRKVARRRDSSLLTAILRNNGVSCTESAIASSFVGTRISREPMSDALIDG